MPTTSRSKDPTTLRAIAMILLAGLACAACCALPLVLATTGAAAALGAIEPHLAWLGVLVLGVVLAARARSRSDCATACATDGSCGCATKVACTLSDEALDVRIDELRTAFRFLVAVERRGPRELVLRFRDEHDVHERVQWLAARERECCAFLDMHVDRAAGEIVWTLSGPERARDALTFFETLPARLESDADDALRAHFCETLRA